MVFYRNSFLYFLTPIVLIFLTFLISPTNFGLNKAASQELLTFLLILFLTLLVSRVFLKIRFLRKIVTAENYRVAYVRFRKVLFSFIVLTFLFVVSLILSPSDLGNATNIIQAAAFFVSKFVLFFLFFIGPAFVYLGEKLILLKIKLQNQGVATSHIISDKTQLGQTQRVVSFKYWKSSMIFSSVLWVGVVSYFAYTYIRCAYENCNYEGGLGFLTIFILVPLTISYAIVMGIFLYKKNQSI